MNNKLLTRFLNRKVVKETLGAGYILSPMQKYRLNMVFDYYGSLHNMQDMLRTLSIMIKNDLTNYVGRIKRLKGIPGTSRYTQLLRYGKKEYLVIYQKQSCNKTKHWPNKIQYWLDKGYSYNEAQEQVRLVQVERSKKAALKTTGTSLYTVRSVDFWLNRGYSEIEATEKVKMIQTTNGLEFYKKKYPLDYEKRFKERIDKWQKSIIDNNDIPTLNLKKGHSIESCLAREMSLKEANVYYSNMVERLRKARKAPSKISQKLFDLLDEYLEGPTYYSSKNYEFLINNYRVDFYCKKNKTVVEFYGDFFHRNPNLYEKNFSSLGYTSEEKWNYDLKRENAIRQNPLVDNFIVIWESDFRKNPTSTVEKIIEEIEKCIKKKQSPLEN